jgi:hypothetical protein
VVSSTGGLVRQNGVVSVTRTAVGRYTATFASTISACAVTTTINPPTTAAPGDNLGVAHPIETAATVVTVYTYTRTGAAADRWFTLAVFCP